MIVHVQLEDSMTFTLALHQKLQVFDSLAIIYTLKNVQQFYFVDITY